ncbi:hypothetical protein AB832_07435 [Flavobacteriaceae bacterium (ex Bugula neritina AB1)]|nr:hypothetical protein AB832_07435 [Flavobacteriaceae bacterium (ex Bugula neritina AB1)]
MIEQLKSGEVKTQSGIFKKIRKELKLLLIDLDNLVTKKNLIQLQKSVSDIINSHLTEYAEELLERLKDTGKEAASIEQKSLSNLVKSGVSINVVDNEKLWKKTRNKPLSVKNYTGDLLLERFISGWIKPEIRRINNTIINAYTEARSNKELISAVLGTPSLKNNDGALIKTQRAAEAIARTSIQHVASVSRQAVWEANKDVVKRYQWLSTLDSRTSSTCRSLDGRQFEHGKGILPPIHINCRSSTVGVLDHKYDYLSEGETRASKDGYVDADLTYYQWLKNQPESFQRHVLGDTRAKLLKDGGLTAEQFGRLQLDKNFQPITLDQMRELAPDMFKRANL